MIIHTELELDTAGRICGYDAACRICRIEIDRVSYPAVFQEHRIVSEELDIKGNALVDCTIIRKYLLDKPLPDLKENLFEVLCNDGHKSMCYMVENRKALIEVS